MCNKKSFLPKVEELEAHLISNFSGPLSKFETVDIKKQYPIKIVANKHDIDTLTRIFDNEYFEDSSFLT